jgi:hypothetical protein
MSVIQKEFNVWMTIAATWLSVQIQKQTVVLMVMTIASQVTVRRVPVKTVIWIQIALLEHVVVKNCV